MSRILTGDKLISSVRKRSMSPEDTSVFTDQDILDIANEEMDVQLLDKLLSLHEEHLTTHVDLPRTEEGAYDIPYRAIGNKIRDVGLVNNPGPNETVWELSQISLGELPDYSFDSGIGQDLDKFYVESNQLKLIRPARSYDFVRIYFYIRPNVITKLDQAAKISNISSDPIGGTVTINFSNIPKKFNVGLEYDIVGGRTPNKIKAYDLTPTNISSSIKSITFSYSDLEPYLDDIKVGDYVTQAEESPIPNIPTEMHPVLAQLSAVHLLEALGDSEGLRNALARLDKMNTAVMQLVDDRVELAPKKIKPRHGTLYESAVRGSVRKRRGF